jgi:hypothetical protein
MNSRPRLWPRVLLVSSVLALGFASSAKATSIIKLDFSGGASADGTGVACAASGCKFGGNIVINDTTGAIISADFTFSGESPVMGPFTLPSIVQGYGCNFFLDIADASNNTLQLCLYNATSLKGYTGGFVSADAFGGSAAFKGSGSLTETPTETPEPSSFLILGTAVLGLIVGTTKLKALIA